MLGIRGYARSGGCKDGALYALSCSTPSRSTKWDRVVSSPYLQWRVFTLGGKANAGKTLPNGWQSPKSTVWTSWQSASPGVRKGIEGICGINGNKWAFRWDMHDNEMQVADAARCVCDNGNYPFEKSEGGDILSCHAWPARFASTAVEKCVLTSMAPSMHVHPGTVLSQKSIGFLSVALLMEPGFRETTWRGIVEKADFGGLPRYATKKSNTYHSLFLILDTCCFFVTLK